MRPGLTLAQLRVLEALVRAGHVSGAAAALKITQPSVSKHLATIEARSRQTLFVRAGRRLTPTALTESLLPRIRTLLALADEVDAMLADGEGLRAGTLRVGYSTHQFVMHILGAFMDAHRGIRIEARCMASFDLLAQLRGGGLDAAFVTMPGAEADLDILELRREALVLMVGPDHPLAGRDSLPLRDLAGLPLVQREASSGTRRTLEAVAVGAGVTLTPAMSLGSWEPLRGAVLAGIGAGVAMAGEVRGDPDLRAVPILTGAGRPLEVGHYLVCPAGARRLAAIAALFEVSGARAGARRGGA